jgi:type III secretion protein U
MSEKTEQPTAKKIREARERGEVAKSKDFTQTALIVALFGYLIGSGASIADTIMQMMVAPFSMLTLDFATAANGLATTMLKEAIGLVLPALLIVIGIGVLAEAVQTGMLISFKALMPSAKKLNVLSNAKNMVSKKNLVEFLKSIVKIAFLSALMTLLVRDAMHLLVDLPDVGFVGMSMVLGALLRTMLAHIALAYAVIALADLVWQRAQYRKGLMMSKDEVKQEHKQMEGDPHIKHERKQIHRELLEHGAVQSARKASVVVTNPTHLAIALRYEAEVTPLPVVLAKGEGTIAQRMMDAAREAGVPVLQNIALAHALFDEASVDQYIPSELVEPVAEVLRLVRKMASGSTDSTRNF